MTGNKLMLISTKHINAYINRTWSHVIFLMQLCPTTVHLSMADDHSKIFTTACVTQQ